jgi:hypothetical protein
MPVQQLLRADRDVNPLIIVLDADVTRARSVYEWRSWVPPNA